MSNATRARLFLAAALLLLTAPAFAQSAGVFTLLPASEMSVDGTSNKSDWTVHAAEIEGFVKMSPDATADAPGVEEARITVPAAKLESRRSTIMDRLMRKAMKVEQHPEIVYALKEVVEVVPGATANTFGLKTRGDLTLAGETREIEMDIVGTILDNSQVQFEGSYSLLMSDYNIQRPTAMFGALITGDEVTVNYTAVFGPSAAGSQ